MGQIQVTPRVLKNIGVRINGDDYANAIASMKFIPSASIQTWKGGTPDAVFTDVTSATWVCEIKYAQDFESATSLAIYFLQHQGETEEVLFYPYGFTDGAPNFSAHLIYAPGEIGGDIDAWLESTVQHAVSGTPFFNPAAPH